MQRLHPDAAEAERDQRAKLGIDSHAEEQLDLVRERHLTLHNYTRPEPLVKLAVGGANGGIIEESEQYTPNVALVRQTRSGCFQHHGPAKVLRGAQCFLSGTHAPLCHDRDAPGSQQPFRRNLIERFAVSGEQLPAVGSQRQISFGECRAWAGGFPIQGVPQGGETRLRAHQHRHVVRA
jgi:hypothetical protein